MTDQRVLGRVRLSRLTDESTSVEGQKKAITQEIDRRGDTLVGWAVDTDVSRKVKPFDAPEFGKWLTPEGATKWDMVVASKLDRFGSGVIALNGLIAWCKAHDKVLISISPNVDTSGPMADLLVTLFSQVAQSELDLIQERILDSRVRLRDAGRWPGGTPFYGYRAVKDPNGPGWKLKPDRDAFLVLNRIIDEFLGGTPLESICAGLSEDRVLTPLNHYRLREFEAALAAEEAYTGTIPERKAWQPTTLQKLLPSKSLLGYVVHNGVTERNRAGNPVTFGAALIPPQRFDQIQGELARRKGAKTQRDRNTGQLLDIVKCKECELEASLNDDGKGTGNLHHRTQYKKPRADGSPGKVYRYYYCPKKHFPHVRAEILEDAVELAFMALLGDAPRLKRVYVRAEDHTAERDTVIRGIGELAKSQAAVTTEIAKGIIAGQILTQDLRLAELNKMPNRPARTVLKPVGSTYADEWAGLDEVGRRNLLRESGITFPIAPSSQGNITFDMSVPVDIRARMNLDPSINQYYDLSDPSKLPPIAHLQAAARVNATQGRPMVHIKRFPLTKEEFDSEITDQVRVDLGMEPLDPNWEAAQKVESIAAIRKIMTRKKADDGPAEDGAGA